MQTDPIGYKNGMNWYAYVGNDPVNQTDPSGMFSSEAYFPNPAMYELYGVEGTREVLSEFDKGGEVAGHLLTAGAATVKAVKAAGSAYRAHRYNKRMEKVRERLKGWTEEPNSKKSGSRFQDQDNKGNRVRVDKGDPDHNLPRQKVDHVVEQKGGKLLMQKEKKLNQLLKPQNP